jgi:hypothetical protein
VVAGRVCGGGSCARLTRSSLDGTLPAPETGAEGAGVRVVRVRWL